MRARYGRVNPTLLDTSCSGRPGFCRVSGRSAMRLRVLLEPLHGGTYDQIVALARATEEAGFDAFFRSDHYLGVDREATYLPTDSWTTLGGLARDTSRVRLGTLLTAATFRRPGVLATIVATATSMSRQFTT